MLHDFSRLSLTEAKTPKNPGIQPSHKKELRASLHLQLEEDQNEEYPDKDNGKYQSIFLQCNSPAILELRSSNMKYLQTWLEQEKLLEYQMASMNLVESSDRNTVMFLHMNLFRI